MFGGRWDAEGCKVGSRFGYFGDSTPGFREIGCSQVFPGEIVAMTSTLVCCRYELAEVGRLSLRIERI